MIGDTPCAQQAAGRYAYNRPPHAPHITTDRTYPLPAASRRVQAVLHTLLPFVTLTWQPAAPFPPAPPTPAHASDPIRSKGSKPAARRVLPRRPGLSPTEAIMSWTFLLTAGRRPAPFFPPLVFLLACAALVSSLVFPATPLRAQSHPVDINDLSAELTSREAQLVAAVNQKRADAGLLPLRWNRELSEAARWFARDSVEARSTCGHTDSLGRGPGTRLRLFGYANLSLWGEAVVCGFTEPAAAVAAWLNSPVTASTLLDPLAREAGVGYYYNAEKGRGFVVLDVSAEPNFAPAVLNNEEVSSSTPAVTLTIHPQPAPAVALKVANTADFAGAAWEPFVTHKQWTLEGGTGWRTVYVLVRDATGRTSMLSDVIYLGAAAPKGEISLDHATNIGSALAIETPEAAKGAPLRLSLGWLLDDRSPTLQIYQGSSDTVEDPSAVGGSTLLLRGGGRAALVIGTIGDLPHDKLLTAYVRLKVSDHSGSEEVARLLVRANGQLFGPLVLHANDFAASDRYQEFALNFAFPAAAQSPSAAAQSTLAEVELERTGAPDITLDVVRFFSQPMPASARIVWDLGGAVVRNQGVMARVESSAADGLVMDLAYAAVDPPQMDSGEMPPLSPSPARLVFRVDGNGAITPLNAVVTVCELNCNALRWQAGSNVPWLHLQAAQEGILVRVDAAGMARGIYPAVITITPLPSASAAGAETRVDAAVAPATVPVEVWVDGAEPLKEADVKALTYLPLARRP